MGNSYHFSLKLHSLIVSLNLSQRGQIAPFEVAKTIELTIQRETKNNLLTAICSDIDNPPQKTRAMVYEAEPDAEWATQEILITVKT